MRISGIAAIAGMVLVSGCGDISHTASRLPGLREASDRRAEKELVEWMESDPVPEVRARVAKHDYHLLGLARYSRKDYWIPGVAGHKATHGRYDVTWQGISGEYEKHVPQAESYMARFNRLMLEERKGVRLDVYGRGPGHPDYLPAMPHRE